MTLFILKARQTATGELKWDVVGEFKGMQSFLEAYTQHVLAGDHVRVAEGVGELRQPGTSEPPS